MRIGQGIDAHAFSSDPDRPLVLGGVTVDASPGLAGHSDADVAVHALIDALLSGAGLGDLGRQFGVDDPSLGGIDSMVLLAQTVEHIAASGFWCLSASITILAQRPRLADRLDHAELVDAVVQGGDVLLERLLLDLASGHRVDAGDQLELGAIGRAEGIAAHAIALLEEAS